MVRSIIIVILLLSPFTYATNERNTPMSIKLLTSDNVLDRYNAQSYLSSQSPEIVIPDILKELNSHVDSSKEWEYLANGLTRIIREMIVERGAKEESINTHFKSESDLKPLIWTLTSSNKYNQLHDATIVLMFLRDHRIISHLFDILENPRKGNEKYYASIVLSDLFPVLDNTKKNRVLNDIKALRGDLGERTQKVLNSIGVKLHSNGSNPIPIGWIYMGFSVDTKAIASLPSPGSIFTAKQTEVLFDTYPRFDQTSGQWVPTRLIVGLIRPNQETQVIDVQNSSDFYFMQVAKPIPTQISSSTQK